MRDHAYNLIFLGTKMKTSIPAFGKTTHFPCHWAKSRCKGMLLVVKTPRFLCMGKMYSSGSKAMVTPTEMASCPIPLNHLEILPCRKKYQHFLFYHAGLEHSLIEVYKYL